MKKIDLVDSDAGPIAVLCDKPELAPYVLLGKQPQLQLERLVRWPGPQQPEPDDTGLRERRPW